MNREDDWFSKYDSESFEKDFMNIKYSSYIIIVTNDPAF